PAMCDAWLESACVLTQNLNELSLLRWIMDKRYLTALADAGIPGVPTSWHDEEASLADALQEAARRAAGSDAADPSATHVVLKPSVGAGARLAGLLRPDDPAAQIGRAHV